MKYTKNNDLLKNLRVMVKNAAVKEAEMAQTNLKGTPAGDVKSESSKDSTETTDKNNVGADKNKPQEYAQDKAKDEQNSEPLKGAKSASVKDLAADLTKDIDKSAEEAQKGLKGGPAEDVKSESSADATEKTDKNAVGADKNKPQEYEQKPAPDKQDSEPLKHAKKAEAAVDEMAVKVAGYQLGRQFAAAILKQSNFRQETNTDLLKSAGSRDFEKLIAYAEAELDPQAAYAETTKVAEAQGMEYFDALLKQSSFETVLEDNASMKQKIAELEAKVAETTKTASETKGTLDKAAAEKLAADQEEALLAKLAARLEARLKSDATTVTK
jgi:hypothetical protein